MLAGARGIVQKEEPAETILKAIEKIHAGQLWLDRIATGRIFVALARKSAVEDADPARHKISTLTARERGIIVIIATNPGANAMAVADRPGRQGFPADVMEDLIMLYEINEMLMGKPALEQRAEWPTTWKGAVRRDPE